MSLTAEAPEFIPASYSKEVYYEPYFGQNGVVQDTKERKSFNSHSSDDSTSTSSIKMNMNTESAAGQGMPLVEVVRNQVEYYFSQNNLTTDKFMQKNMDENGFIPISIIANFRKVKQLTTDEQVIIDAIEASDGSICILDEDKTKIKATWIEPSELAAFHKAEKKSIILRDVPSNVTMDDIAKLLKDFDAKSIRKDAGQTWFVTMETEEAAKEALAVLMSSTLHGVNVWCALKTESALDASFSAGQNPNNGYVDPYFYNAQAPFYHPQMMQQQMYNYQPYYNQYFGQQQGYYAYPQPQEYQAYEHQHQQGFAEQTQSNDRPQHSGTGSIVSSGTGTPSHIGAPRPRQPFNSSSRGGYSRVGPTRGSSYSRPAVPRRSYENTIGKEPVNAVPSTSLPPRPRPDDNRFKREIPGRRTNKKDDVPVTGSPVERQVTPDFKSHEFPSLTTAATRPETPTGLSSGNASWAKAVAKQPTVKADELPNLTAVSSAPEIRTSVPQQQVSVEEVKPEEPKIQTQKPVVARAEPVPEVKPTNSFSRTSRGWEKPEATGTGSEAESSAKDEAEFSTGEDVVTNAMEPVHISQVQTTTGPWGGKQTFADVIKKNSPISANDEEGPSGDVAPRNGNGHHERGGFAERRRGRGRGRGGSAQRFSSYKKTFRGEGDNWTRGAAKPNVNSNTEN